MMNHKFNGQLSIVLFLVVGIGSIFWSVNMATKTSNTSHGSATAESASSAGVANPFPQNLTFPDCIRPNNVSQVEMNNSIKSYYDYWKKTYIRESNGVTPGGGCYVSMKGTGGSGDEITTSEAHGYGMIIFALMAGYDAQAKGHFDGMFNMFDKHRSKNNPNNMSWLIDKSEQSSKDQDSATDGDMDIAYALLLADRQWGSNGKINYLEEARKIITDGIKKSAMSEKSKRPLLGDNSPDQYATRASDWMTDHFKAFQKATGDNFWGEAAKTVYDMINLITLNHSSITGLMPDFVVGHSAEPARPNFLEAKTDGDYSWNACRYPWRLATDFAHHQSPEARAAANKVVNWIKDNSGGDPRNIKAGYKLDGTPLAHYSDPAFTSPIIAAAMVDSSHQAFLNSGWDVIKNWKDGYYGDTINMLCMLLISGNWWSPDL